MRRARLEHRARRLSARDLGRVVSEPAIPQISQGELIARLNDPSLTIVNVLAREAWQSQHIPGSLSLPLAEIQARAAAVLPDRDADIAVYCASPT